MKKLIPWESSCFSISPEFFVVWLIYLDEELLAVKRNRLEVNRTFSGRRFAGCLPLNRSLKADCTDFTYKTVDSTLS